MLALGFVLLALGLLAIVAAAFLGEGEAQLVGLDLPVLALVLVGVATGVCLVTGLVLTQRGTKREWRVHRDRKQLRKYQQKEQGASGTAPESGTTHRRDEGGTAGSGTDS